MAPPKKKTATKRAASKKTGRPKPAAKKSAAKTSAAKTIPTEVSVKDFVASVENPKRRADAQAALSMYKAITGAEPKMWGPSIIGYGSYHYKYESGREGDMCAAGFSPRGSAMVFYIMGGVPEGDPLYARLGKHRLGKSCLYVNRLEDIDADVLRRIIARSWAYMMKAYPHRK
ncbi:MAG TPA: hypothetical protein DDZ68_15995 [Parvularcula sp.]|nr:hypothetical protein [Parvularcula sp.]HBS33210.1 hypothetical protein [Parvularcula sp.]HBS34364.1 hypothetical protein [Parvularcula sp.]